MMSWPMSIFNAQPLWDGWRGWAWLEREGLGQCERWSLSWSAESTAVVPFAGKKVSAKVSANIKRDHAAFDVIPFDETTYVSRGD